MQQRRRDLPFMCGELSGENRAFVLGDLPLDYKWNVLGAVHDFGYVYKRGLAQLMRVNEVTMGRFIDQLVRERFVRLAGYPVGSDLPAFRSKYFYTPTRADLGKRPEIEGFCARPDYVTMAGRMPLCCFLARRGSRPNGVAGSMAKAGQREEWVPIHYAGAHVAMAFVASVINESADVDTLDFKPERLLRRSATPLAPMPDGILWVNGRNHGYQVEFESYPKGRKKIYKQLFDLYERAVLPTLYVAQTLQIASVLDSVARDRKRIAVVMYGDQAGCASAIEGLNDDLFWQPPRRYLAGPMAGYDLEKAEDYDVAPPGGQIEKESQRSGDRLPDLLSWRELSSGSYSVSSPSPGTTLRNAHGPNI
jgi:hypothetical protein